MTRDELYRLVWQYPITHLAARFGLSDVGLRKLCVRHAIPVPPRGYWSKLRAKGGVKPKKPRQPPLPPLAPGVSDLIDLPSLAPGEVIAPPPRRPAKSKPPVFVLPEPRGPLHRYVATKRGLVPSEDGSTVTTIGPGVVRITVTPPLADRALLLADLFLRCAEARGHEAITDSAGVMLKVAGETFAFTIEEGTREVVLIRADKKLKAERAAALKRGEVWMPPHQRHRRWYELRADDGKRHFNQRGREHDGRLVLAVTGVGRWYDRSGRQAEDYVAAAVAAIEADAAERPIRRQREAEEKLRRQRMWDEARVEERREAARERRRKFLVGKAAAYQTTRQLAAYLASIERLEDPAGQRGVDRLIRELRAMVQERLNVTREQLESEIADLFGEDD